MESELNTAVLLLPLISALIFSSTASALTSPTAQINSNSILVALLDSPYTDLSELIEKALLLPTLEQSVYLYNLTVFAPRNEALERAIDPDFRRFLLEPRNLKSLQTLILSHFVPSLIPSSTQHRTLSGERISVSRIDLAHSDAIIRPDGIIHGIDRILIPRSVQQAFNRRRNLADISAVLPVGAPEVDPRTRPLKIRPGSPPSLPIFAAMAPGPSLAPAPAPGPGSAKRWFDGHRQINDFIQTLILYGGYNEFADVLVNLTSLSTEMGRLVSEGYVLTVLAPNDEAMAKLSADQLGEPGSAERIVYYHLIPEYQTEESMYNAVRRFGRVRYDTLRLPEKVVAREADGSVKFGRGEGSAYLFDPDIYTDGRISVQGIDAVLFPPNEDSLVSEPPASRNAAPVPKMRRGKLLELGCHLLGAFTAPSSFVACQ